MIGMDGKQVADLPVSQDGHQEVRLQKGKISAGVYMYTLVVDGTRTAMKKMIIQN